jgi:hypothetical protein
MIPIASTPKIISKYSIISVGLPSNTLNSKKLRKYHMVPSLIISNKVASIKFSDRKNKHRQVLMAVLEVILTTYILIKFLLYIHAFNRQRKLFNHSSCVDFPNVNYPSILMNHIFFELIDDGTGMVRNDLHFII